MRDEPFDDAPQWYWAAATERGDHPVRLSGDRFVVASGQRELWERVRSEVEPDERCSWMGFGSRDGKATLADCMRVLLMAREMYGANLNRIMVELAEVPVFASFVRETPSRICDRVSNPINHDPLPREPYSRDAERRLGQAVGQTLGLPDEWWTA